MDKLKRELREEKREVKRRGNKHRRQMLKRSLRENPEDAHWTVPSVGRYRSENLNGIDRDGTRSCSGTTEASEEGSSPGQGDGSG